MTQTLPALATVAFAFSQQWAGARFCWVCCRELSREACPDREGLGSNLPRPTLRLGCGNNKHRVDSPVIGRKPPSVSSQEERNRWVSSDLGAGVISSLRSSPHMSFSHPRWSLPPRWQAAAPPVPTGQHLQASFEGRKYIWVEHCPKPSWAALLGRWQTGSQELGTGSAPHQLCEFGLIP